MDEYLDLSDAEYEDLELTNATQDDIDLARATYKADTAMANATEALRRLDTPPPPTGKRRPAWRRAVR